MPTTVVTNQYKGVTNRGKGRHPYKAQIHHQGRCYYLGVYKTAIEAALVYDKKAEELFGAQTVLNFPVSDARKTVEIITKRVLGPERLYEEILTIDFLHEQYVKSKKPVLQIAKECNLDRQTVVNYLKRYGIERRSLLDSRHRTYDRPSNVDGFAGPTSDWYAYWLGFIAADGCIWGNRLTIRLKAADRCLLENFRNGIGASQPIRKGITNGNHPYAFLEIYHSPLIEILAHWGIVRNKTHRLLFPSIPEQYQAAFIRGYFDGDGTIYKRVRSPRWVEFICRFISGSPHFLDELGTRLHRLGITTIKRYRNQKSNAFVLPLSGSRTNLINFADLIYTGATIFLQRKREVFDALEKREVING